MAHPDLNVAAESEEGSQPCAGSRHRCPECQRGSLRHDQTSASCDTCAAVFEVVDGVVDFSSGTSGTSSTKKDYDKTLARLLEDTVSRGWLDALQDDLPAASAEYATDTRKSDFLHLLGLKEKTRALDLGCGLGPITVAMAHEFERVDALDAILEQARFVNLRAQQSGLSNIACSSAPPGGVLPYDDHAFDLVVMRGVNEWVATARGMAGMSPIACQGRVLREVFRVLRPGGLLYLTTKNRFALRYLLGLRDEHTGLPFTSLMPAALVNAVQRLRTGQACRTRLHTKRSLRSLLGEAGFDNVDFWALLPDFRFPTCYVETSDARALRTTKVRRLGFARLLRRERLAFSLLPSQAISLFAYCYAAVARKERG